MEARYVALLILVPFAFVFAYATWHEYKRFKAEGRSSYGLTYDPETNTTHVGPIPEDEEAYDLDDYDPDLLETTAKEAEEDGMADRDGTETDEERETARDTEDPQDDDKPQDTRT
ncbi:hypothetical protein [Roseovarius sp. D22-M7]|uniref:hypothetical protein n=1 Tax=Roseovarius sp. D22-M7 TaxID=3127116 RepID=UPI00300FF892